MSIQSSSKQLFKKWKRLLIVFFIISFTATIIIKFFERNSTTTHYITTVIERGDIKNIVSATGTVQPIIIVQVGSQVSGTIAWLSADFNQHVKRDMLIARIDPATFQAQVDNTIAALQSANAAEEMARMDISQNKANIESTRSNVQLLKVQIKQKGRSTGTEGKGSLDPRKESNTQIVWVLNGEGKLIPHKLGLGITDGKATEVTNGDLKEGERIVLGQGGT